MQKIRYLALGDSYTIGESVSEAERWPNQLAALVSPSGDMDVTIIARTGWTTSELWEGIQAANPQGTYDMVSLLIGVNNQYRGRSVDDYRMQLRGLLARAIDYAGGAATHVIVLSIPDWGVTPFARDSGRDSAVIAAEIDAYNAVKRDECRRVGVAYVDITALTREARGRPELLAADGLHPSAIDYARWAQAALPAAQKALQP